MSERLPDGWVWRTLDEVVDVVQGQSPPGASYNDEGVGVPFFQGKAEFGDLRPSVRKWTTDPKKLAAENDVLLSVRAPVGPTNLAPGACAIGRGLAALRPGPEVLTMFLLHWMRVSERELASQATGTTFAAITGKVVRKHPIPIPPLDEQRRIVDAIETHLSHLDAGVESLRRAKRNIERMRASLLRVAVEGRLVRSSVVFGEPTASRTVASIGGSPEHWSVHPMGDLAETRLGKMLSKKARQGLNPKPYLRNQNVQWGRFDLTDVAEMDILPEEMERYLLQPGDLIVCEGGEVARCAIWAAELPEIYYQKALHRVRPNSGVRPEWLALVLKYLASNRLLGRFVTGSTIDHLPQEDLRIIPIPLPPVDEMQRILDEVSRQSSIVDALEDKIDIGLRRSKAMRSAVLRAAFNGLLVRGGEAAA